MRRPLPRIIAMLLDSVGLACSWREPSSPGTNGSEWTKLSSRSVDLPFVVDNTADMDRAQAQLAADVGALTDRLGSSDISYRVAVTTTDNGNPWCPVGATTPEGGGEDGCFAALVDRDGPEFPERARESARADRVDTPAPDTPHGLPRLAQHPVSLVARDRRVDRDRSRARGRRHR